MLPADTAKDDVVKSICKDIIVFSAKFRLFLRREITLRGQEWRQRGVAARIPEWRVQILNHQKLGAGYSVSRCLAMWQRQCEIAGAMDYQRRRGNLRWFLCAVRSVDRGDMLHGRIGILYACPQAAI